MIASTHLVIRLETRSVDCEDLVGWKRSRDLGSL